MPSPASLHHLLLPFPSTLQPLPLLAAASHRRQTPPKPQTLTPHPFTPSSSSFAAADDDYGEEEVVVGDCLVFEDGAFDHDYELPSRSRSRPRRRAGRGGSGGSGESLVPEKWRHAAEELNLTKKEKRRIRHQLRFGSRLERRRPPAVAAPDEYPAFRGVELSLPALDYPRPRDVLPEEVEAAEQPPTAAAAAAEPVERVSPRNPRLGMAEGSLEDVAEFFNSRKYALRGTEDDKSPGGRRKLFTPEEKVLLNKRVPDLEASTTSKWLPLHSLAASGEFYLLDNLLKFNVDINAVDKDGLSAIHKAILSKKQAIVNYLLRNSANPFIRDEDGATLMHYAVLTACSPAVKILLLYNVDINRPDDYGWTPLHLAVQTQRTDIVKLLLIKGADRTLKNQDGLTPLGLCLHLGHHLRTYELIKLLKSFGLPKQHDSVHAFDVL